MYPADITEETEYLSVVRIRQAPGSYISENKRGYAISAMYSCVAKREKSKAVS